MARTATGTQPRQRERLTHCRNKIHVLMYSGSFHYPEGWFEAKNKSITRCDHLRNALQLKYRTPLCSVCNCSSLLQSKHISVFRVHSKQDVPDNSVYYLFSNRQEKFERVRCLRKRKILFDRKHRPRGARDRDCGLCW